MPHQNKILNDNRRLLRLLNGGTVFTSFDTETTGLSRTTDRIIEVGCVKFDRTGIIGRWSSLVNPCRPVPRMITELTHISMEMLRNCPAADSVIPEFKNFTDGTVLVAHNARFDLNFINEECGRLGCKAAANSAIDTLQLARWAYPSLGKYSLSFLADRMGIRQTSAHRAADDADVCRQIFLRILEDTAELQKA